MFEISQNVLIKQTKKKKIPKYLGGEMVSRQGIAMISNTGS